MTAGEDGTYVPLKIKENVRTDYTDIKKSIGFRNFDHKSDVVLRNKRYRLLRTGSDDTFEPLGIARRGVSYVSFLIKQTRLIWDKRT